MTWFSTFKHLCVWCLLSSVRVSSKTWSEWAFATSRLVGKKTGPSWLTAPRMLSYYSLIWSLWWYDSQNYLASSKRFSHKVIKATYGLANFCSMDCFQSTSNCPFSKSWTWITLKAVKIAKILIFSRSKQGTILWFRSKTSSKRRLETIALVRNAYTRFKAAISTTQSEIIAMNLVTSSFTKFRCLSAPRTVIQSLKFWSMKPTLSSSIVWSGWKSRRTTNLPERNTRRASRLQIVMSSAHR